MAGFNLCFALNNCLFRTDLLCWRRPEAITTMLHLGVTRSCFVLCKDSHGDWQVTIGQPSWIDTPTWGELDSQGRGHVEEDVEVVQGIVMLEMSRGFVD